MQSRGNESAGSIDHRGSAHLRLRKFFCQSWDEANEQDGVGALHVMNQFNQTADPQWFGGTALAIAYTSDETSVQPNDFTVISVNQGTVWYRAVSYSIPAALPACPAGGCLCTWNWIHEANHGEGYPYEIVSLLFALLLRSRNGR